MTESESLKKLKKLNNTRSKSSTSSVETLKKKLRGSHYVAPSSKSSGSDIDNIISNYQTRLKASGIEDTVSDDRNPLEKALNLKQNQGFLMDLAEVADRPANALRGGIQESVEGGSFGEGLSKGITGNKEYYLGNVLRDVGVNDDPLFKNPLNGNDVSMSDIVGLVGDVVVDPLNIAAPVSLVGKADKIAKTTKTLSDATDALQVARRGVKSLENSSDAKALAAAMDTLTKADNEYKAAKLANQEAKNIKVNTILEDLVKGTGKVVGGTVKLADKGISKALKTAENIGTKNLEKRITKANKYLSKEELADVISKVTNEYKSKSVNNLYNTAKQGINNVLDYNKNALPGGIMGDVKATDESLDVAESVVMKRINDQEKATKDYFEQNSANIKKMFGKKDMSSDDFNELLTLNRESKKNLDVDMAYLFRNMLKKNAKTQKLTITADSAKKAEKVMNSIKRLEQANKDGNLYTFTKLNDNEYELTLNFGKNSNKQLMKTVANNKNIQDILKELKVTKSSKLNDIDKKDIAKLNELYNKDKKFKELVDSNEGIFNEVSNVVKELTGKDINLNNIFNREGYIRKSINSKGVGTGKTRNANMLGNLEKGKTTDYTTRVLNREREEKRLNAIENIDKNINKLEEGSSQLEDKMTSLQETKRAINENKSTSKMVDAIKTVGDTKELKALKDSIDTSSLTKETKAMRKKIIDAQIGKIEADNIYKRTKLMIDDLEELTSKDISEAIKKCGNKQEAKSFINAAQKYKNSLKEQNKIQKMLDKSPNDKSIAEKLKEASEKALNEKNNFDIRKAKMEGALQNSTMKEVKRANTVLTNYTKKSINQAKRTTSKTNKFAQVSKQVEKNLNRLKAKENRLTMEIENLDPTLEENIAKREARLAKIENLQSSKEFLESKAGQKYYNDNYFRNLEDSVKATIKQTKDIQKINSIILKTGLNDDRVIKFLDVGETVPSKTMTHVHVSKEDMMKLSTFMKKSIGLMPEESKELLKTFDSMLKNSNGVLMNKEAYRVLYMSKDINKSANLLNKAVSGYVNTFKKFSTLSLGFQMRNVTGNWVNQWLSGIPAHALVKEHANAMKLAKGDYMVNLLTKAVNDKSVLTKTELNELDLVMDFLKSGFLGQGTKVRDLEEVLFKVENTDRYKNKAKKAIDAVFKGNMKLNEFGDATSRIAIMSYAKKNPKYMSKLGVKTPVDAAKFVAFDPVNMSPWEINVAKKFIPFYTFTKQNLIFQSKNLMKNTSKYSNLLKFYNRTYEAVGENNMQDYQKDQLQTPIYTDSNGNTLVLKTNLPTADLGEWLSSPVDKLAQSSNPLLQMIYEKATGTNLLTKRENTKTAGDYLASNLGLNNFSKKFDNLGELSSDNTSSKNTQLLLNTILGYNNQDNIATNRQYELLSKYQDFFSNSKASGNDIPTLTELKKAGYDTEAIKEQIRKANKIMELLKRNRGN